MLKISKRSCGSKAYGFFQTCDKTKGGYLKQGEVMENKAQNEQQEKLLRKLFYFSIIIVSLMFIFMSFIPVYDAFFKTPSPSKDGYLKTKTETPIK
jgi:hypothetical protein